MRIEDLNLSLRTYNCLKRAGIDTVQQLKSLSAQQLSDLRGMGPTGMVEILEKVGYGRDIIVPTEVKIYCCECQHWAQPSLPGVEIDWGVCRKLRGHYPKADFYCGYAERRTK